MRVRATSLNYRDLMVLKGGRGPTKLGVVPPSDGAVFKLHTGTDNRWRIFGPPWAKPILLQ
jgi:hypothetical protein